MSEKLYIRGSIIPARAVMRVTPKLAGLRFAVMLLCFLALAVQGFVVQTHIHLPQAAGKAQTVSLITLAAAVVSDASGKMRDPAPGAPRDKYPIDEDPSNCPLCQEIAHSGQFIQSAAILAVLPRTVKVHSIVFEEALPSFFAVSHVWQGRAPPVRSLPL